MRNANPQGWSCLVLLPRGEYWEDGRVRIESGFLPPPPLMLQFELQPGEAAALEQGAVPPAVVQALAAQGITPGNPPLQIIEGGWLLSGQTASGEVRQYRLRLTPGKNVLEIYLG